MHAAKDEDPAALHRKRIDDGLDLAQRLAGMKLGFDIMLALKQFQVGDCLETDDFVAAGGVDNQIARDGEQIGAAGGHILPVFRGIGAGQNLRHHILKLMGRRQDAPEASAKRGLLRQYDHFEPF